MNPFPRLALWVRPFVFLGHNGITLTGAVLTTASALTMLGFWGLEVLQLRPVHPYAGIILFFLLPGVFIVGLLMMPAGVLWRRFTLRRRGLLPSVYPKVDVHEPVFRRAFGLASGATVLNVVILSAASYQGVEYMDSSQFCGLTCHTVMAPEHTAYLTSPHSRVACVQCHIGPGASWFVRSKLSGTRQILAVALGTYSRPIPTPVKYLRPARETCEQCHWPQKFQGDKFVVRTKYSDDEKNTPLTTVLVLKIGGGTTGSVGIHGRHLDAAQPISYLATDDHRQVVPRVKSMEGGKEIEYVSTEIKTTPEQLARAERRQMDCVDCHNRPSHVFEMPDRAVDRALSAGGISVTLPFVKKKAVELLRVDYPDRTTAALRIAQGLTDYYRTAHPDVYKSHRALVQTAAQELQAIYARNVFPEMKVSWGTYPNNIGHDDSIGCFRCHDDNHKSASGATITQDCTACHTILAQDESNPKILADLGIK